MTTAGKLLGIPPDAMPAWVSLCAALDRLEDTGRKAVCLQRPDQWSADAKPSSRADAAEACGYCPVLHSCAAYADAAGERWGVWGGVDRTTHRPTRKRQEKAA